MARTNGNGVNGTNGHANPTTTNGNAATTTSSGLATPFTPIHPGVRDGVGDLAALLADTKQRIDDINSASEEMTSPTMEGLHADIKSLSTQLDDVKSSQNAETGEIKTEVGQLKFQIHEVLRDQMNSQITDEIKVQVKASVDDWKSKAPLIGQLEKMLESNDAVLKDAQIKLINSKARRENSTFDEIYNFDDPLQVIWDSNEQKSDLYPDNLRQLFKYSDAQVERLLQFYDLRDCGNKIDNLNRFLAFIGMMFVIPEQGAVSWGGENTEADGPGPNVEHAKQEEKKAGKSGQKEAGNNEKKEVGQGEKEMGKGEKTTEAGTEKADNQDGGVPDTLEPPKGQEGKSRIENRQRPRDLQRLQTNSRVSSPTFNKSASAWPHPKEATLRRKPSGPMHRSAAAVEGASWIPGWFAS